MSVSLPGDLEAPPLRRTNSSIEEYNCPVCHALLCQPSTLVCGHTACRSCLKRWLETSPTARCPAGCSTIIPRVVPAVNILLKERIEKGFPEEYAQRKKEVEEDEAAAAAAAAASAANTPSPTPAGGDAPVNIPQPIAEPAPDLAQQLAGLDALGQLLAPKNVCVQLGIYAVVACLIFYARLYYPSWTDFVNRESGSVDVHAMTPLGVDNWAAEWQIDDFIHTALRAHEVDGSTLVKITDVDRARAILALSPEAGDDAALKRFVLTIKTLTIDDSKPVTDLWSFRDKYRSRFDEFYIWAARCPRVLLATLSMSWVTPADTEPEYLYRLLGLLGDQSFVVLLMVVYAVAPKLVMCRYLLLLASTNPWFTFAVVNHLIGTTRSDFSYAKTQWRNLEGLDGGPRVHAMARWWLLDRGKALGTAATVYLLYKIVPTALVDVIVWVGLFFFYFGCVVGVLLILVLALLPAHYRTQMREELIRVFQQGNQRRRPVLPM